MTTQLEILLDKIKVLETELIEELQKQEEEFSYCSYVNGLFAYLQEIAGRTEQFWCPIKHAKRLKILHSRYQKFVGYGDANTYRSNVEKIRRDFKDLE